MLLIYKDFIRQHGAPSALTNDDAKEELSEEVKEINKNFVDKDHSLSLTILNKTW